MKTTKLCFTLVALSCALTNCARTTSSEKTQEVRQTRMVFDRAKFDSTRTNLDGLVQADNKDIQVTPDQYATVVGALDARTINNDLSLTASTMKMVDDGLVNLNGIKERRRQYADQFIEAISSAQRQCHSVAEKDCAVSAAEFDTGSCGTSDSGNLTCATFAHLHAVDQPLDAVIKQMQAFRAKLAATPR